MLEIIISIIIAICYGIAASMQKYSFSNMNKFSIRTMIKNIKWIAAMAIGGIGVILYLLSLTFIPLSTLQPMLALSIIIPVIAGALIFKERLLKIEIFCIVLILMGIILLVI